MEDAHEAAADAEETNIPGGWESLFRPMTSAERIKFEAEHQFMDEVVFVGLKNLNTGFDAPGIQHFSPADFGEVIRRCEPLHVRPIGIEVFTTDGGFVDCQICPEDISMAEVYNWAQQLVETYQGAPDITMTATFDVPDSLLNLSDPPEVKSCDPPCDDSGSSKKGDSVGENQEQPDGEENE
jgi:hypothetical protein